MIAQEERFKRSLPVKFTVDELRGKADELADKVARREGLEEEKKRVGADYKARVDAITSDVNLLARHITEKCEYQQVECQAFLDHPAYGQKTIIRCDTGEEVGVETMQPTDRQTVIKWQRATEEHNDKGSSEYDAADDYDGPQVEHEDGDEEGAVVEVVEPAAVIQPVVAEIGTPTEDEE